MRRTSLWRLALLALAIMPFAALAACDDPGDMPPPEQPQGEQQF